MGVRTRPGNISQLSCSLAHLLENFCGKYVINAERMQNIRRQAGAELGQAQVQFS